MSILNMTGGAGNSGKRTARFVIGTSTAGWKRQDVDYLCDGTNDEAEINAAINALPSGGGEIVLLDGEYSLSGSIVVNKPNVQLRGSGTSTKIIQKDNYPLARIEADHFCARDMMFEYRGATGWGYGIHLQGRRLPDSTWYQPQFTAVMNCTFRNFLQEAVGALGPNSIVSGCVFLGNNVAYGGINTGLAPKCIIVGNTFDEMLGYAIRVYSDSDGTVISNNTVKQAKYGIESNGCDYLTITGNVFRDCDTAIDISANDYNTITGNICIRGKGSASDYNSTQHTMKLSGGYGLICSNNCMGKAPVISGSSNTVANNKYN